jgi:pentose-5-phosphate-3-epimerase
MQIVPTLLNQSITEFDLQLKTLSRYFNYFQIDIADGELAANRTLQLEDLLIFFNQYPLKENQLGFDFHLMVKDIGPEIRKIEQLKKIIPVRYLLLHLASLETNPNITVPPYGLVLNPNDQIVDLKERYNLAQIPAIQIMTVIPGFQGGEFIPNMLNKIEQLRYLGYRNLILLDGGINEKSLKLILERQHKPDILCIGSYLTKLDQLEDKVNYLRQITATNNTNTEDALTG